MDNQFNHEGHLQDQFARKHYVLEGVMDNLQHFTNTTMALFLVNDQTFHRLARGRQYKSQFEAV